MLAVLLLIGTLADCVTFLMLPPGAEANPIVLAMPVAAAVLVRFGATLLLIACSMKVGPRAREALLGVATAASFLGAGSNLPHL